jgi:CheY-like chemotaxis protein
MVLIVDDQEDSREMLRTWLTMEGYAVHVADDGAEALEVLGQHPVSAVLTDMWMPVMTGAELVTAIRGGSGVERLPIILMSASWRDKPAEIDADAYLPKPFLFPPLRALLTGLGCHATPALPTLPIAA